MASRERYTPSVLEPALVATWAEEGIYHYDPARGPTYAIDTPPPTVSGRLHLGHLFSYSQSDMIARYRRMRGEAVFYPFGFDDNGLPTDRLTEQHLGPRAATMARREFVAAALALCDRYEAEYREVFERLGLSVDWRFQYRTIGREAQRLAQQAFLRLLESGRMVRPEAPVLWCPTCRTGIAQADVNEIERDGILFTLAFPRPDGQPLPVATTRPELLPACVAVLVHPDDSRYAAPPGSRLRLPLDGREIPLLTDPDADPQKGSGAVMVCTFGDGQDVNWWRRHQLPLRPVLGRDGRLEAAAGDLAGLTVAEARRETVQRLSAAGRLLAQQPLERPVPTHERCGTPIEILVAPQWTIRLLDERERWLAAGDAVTWTPPWMAARYEHWVRGLAWDWGISRQRRYGVRFPLWFCDRCGEVIPADPSQLPVAPDEDRPPGPCACGATTASADPDVMDTWMTSSLSPLLLTGMLREAGVERALPLDLRPQAHEIIRTWTFYSIVQAALHRDQRPWSRLMISGWALAPVGSGKLSKSRGGGGALAPRTAIEKYGADAIRYWAASAAPGQDARVDTERMERGMRLARKLWNVARFAAHFLNEEDVPPGPPSLADEWMRGRLAQTVREATAALEAYDPAAALRATESFFREVLADLYLEMVKQRLYEGEPPDRAAARAALREALESVLRLLAPFLPFVTDTLWRRHFATDQSPTVHRAPWPAAGPAAAASTAGAGESLVEIAREVRRYKASLDLSPGAPIATLTIEGDPALLAALEAGRADLASITRAAEIHLLPTAMASAGDQAHPRLTIRRAAR